MTKNAVLEIKQLDITYGRLNILSKINLSFQRNKVHCILGPSGSGKSTLLRSINRINSEGEKLKISEDIIFDEQSIFNKKTNLINLRRQIGMVFQKPIVFKGSISDNILFGIKFHEKLCAKKKKIIIENSLKLVNLWDEVYDRLNTKACNLSLGQQRRLCIARALALNPKVLLMDEPTASLDPISTKSIENLIRKLKEKITVILVTHDVNQADQVADQVIFLKGGSILQKAKSINYLKETLQKEDFTFFNTQEIAVYN